MLKLDSDGNKVWQEGFGSGSTQSGETLFDIRIAPNGSVSFLNRHTYISTSSTDFELQKRNADGSVVFDTYAGSAGVPQSPIAFPPQIQIPTQDDQILLVRQFYHFLLPQSRIELRMIDNNGDLVWEKSFPGQLTVQDGLQNSQGQFVMTGKTPQNKVFLLATDSIGCLFFGTAYGQVFVDENMNCQFDTAEQTAPLASYTVVNDLGIQYGQPGSAGYFTIPVVGGNASLVFSPANPYVQLCQDTFPLTLTDTLVADTVLVPVQVLHECPLMKPQLTLQRVRPCIATTCTVSCGNFGTATAANASLRLTFPGDLEFVSATAPIVSQSGNELVFEIGDLGAGETVQFFVYFDVGCDVEIGDEVCMQAHALPDTICSAAVTGSPFFTEICRIATNSFDPNQKSAFPPGEGTNHWLPADSTIAYLVDFQNTGTDTAFRVVIRDTISAFLDLATVQPGPASHPYTWEILNGGVLKFIFDDIMLPDSNVNEAASHGFVQFEIKPRYGIPNYSLIENSAGIYFDFNEAILTNTVFHNTFNSLVFNEIDTAICAGDAIVGQQVFVDTTLTDTLAALMGDSVLIFHVSVLPVSSDSVEISLCEGEPSPLTGTVYNDEGTFTEQVIFQNQYGCDSVVNATITVHEQYYLTGWGLFPYGYMVNGYALYSDTSFCTYDTTAFGCVNVVCWDYYIVSSATEKQTGVIGLNVFPNPTGGEFFIDFNLLQSTRLNIKISDAVGRLHASVADDEMFAAGKHSLEISTEGWPDGLYIVLVTSEGGGKYYAKLIKSAD